MIELGSAAPELRLPDQHGASRDLASLMGARGLLVVFYPLAFSSVCQGELDALTGADLRGVGVAAVSVDSVFAHRAWADQRGYAFPLLSDFWPHGAVASAYGVLDDQRGTARRASFLVDAGGVVRWSVLHPAGEPRQVQQYADALAVL